MPREHGAWTRYGDPMSGATDDVRQRETFAQLEQVKHEEARRRFRETTPGERLESALDLSSLASELRAGLQPGE